MSVIPLKTFKSECAEDLIEILEDKLARAKEGEFSTGAVVLVRPDGSIMCHFSKSENTHALVAGCSYLAHDIMEGNY